MVFLIILLIVVASALGYGWVRAVNAIFKENPYIKAHRMKINNDVQYQEYLRWLDMEGGDMPFEKWKTEEEERFDKINIFKKHKND